MSSSTMTWREFYGIYYSLYLLHCGRSAHHIERRFYDDMVLLWVKTGKRSDEIVKPKKNSIFLKKGKTVISVENMEFF